LDVASGSFGWRTVFERLVKIPIPQMDRATRKAPLTTSQVVPLFRPSFSFLGGSCLVEALRTGAGAAESMVTEERARARRTMRILGKVSRPTSFAARNRFCVRFTFY